VGSWPALGYDSGNEHLRLMVLWKQRLRFLESTWGKIVVTRGWRKETALMREAVLFFFFFFPVIARRWLENDDLIFLVLFW